MQSVKMLFVLYCPAALAVGIAAQFYENYLRLKTILIFQCSVM